ncbi:oxalate decarboxylase [Tothia fuscella]|uniref:Oxalate decarboxylase n=1 Tax=Tothia fuscella TaxID=1048955 RepID=A0A9P4NKU8_9PEZI|nr:oxalate decarboxylase [Tothia fuscella]
MTQRRTGVAPILWKRLKKNAPNWKQQIAVNDLTHPYAPNHPYTPQHSDPYDRKIDSYGKHLQPLPWRNDDGATILGPQNKDRQKQNPDMMRPPSTDHGDMKNMRWSFADSHTRIEEGGWTRITALDTEGGNSIDDLEKGDLWYFPSGHPHSLQGLAPNGTEFLLIFDDGNFSEESTFLLTDWLAHTSKAVLPENFRIAPKIFNKLPEKEKYIFKGSLPSSIDEENPSGKKINKSKLQLTHKMLAQKAIKSSGGEVRVTDSTNFPISKTMAALHLDIAPSAMREMHWHPNADEWGYVISGRARITIFAAQGTARTFNYMAGDVTIVPRNHGHFIENLSDEEPLEVLEIFRAEKFQDFSLFQWLGETPKRMVEEHLFATSPKAAKKFLEQIDGAEKDLIKSLY